MEIGKHTKPAVNQMAPQGIFEQVYTYDQAVSLRKEEFSNSEYRSMFTEGVYVGIVSTVKQTTVLNALHPFRPVTGRYS